MYDENPREIGFGSSSREVRADRESTVDRPITVGEGGGLRSGGLQYVE